MSKTNKNDFDELGRYWRINKWFPDLSEETRKDLYTYFSELMLFNNKMNLISNRTEKQADLVHIADGIMGAQIIFGLTDRKEIFDIGAGNGVPGIIMAILAPDRKFYLIDSDSRKIGFLKHCIDRLSLKNCSAIHSRLEDLAQESVHCAVSRGFASISKTLLMARRIAASDCLYYHFKGASWPNEVGEIPSQILSSWEPIKAASYNLPEGESDLSIVLTKRTTRK